MGVSDSGAFPPKMDMSKNWVCQKSCFNGENHDKLLLSWWESWQTSGIGGTLLSDKPNLQVSRACDDEVVDVGPSFGENHITHILSDG